MRYDKWKWGVEPFYPNHMLYQGIIVSLVLVVFLSVVFFAPDLFVPEKVAVHLETPADPADTPPHIKPEWYFLPAYQWLKLFPAQWFPKSLAWIGALLGILTQAAVMGVVILWPFLDRSRERDIRKRPILLVVAITGFLFVVALGISGLDPLGEKVTASPEWCYLPAYAPVGLILGSGCPIEESPAAIYTIVFAIFLEMLLIGGISIPPILHALRRSPRPPRRWLLAMSVGCALTLLVLGVYGNYLG